MNCRSRLHCHSFILDVWGIEFVIRTCVRDRIGWHEREPERTTIQWRGSAPESGYTYCSEYPEPIHRHKSDRIAAASGERTAGPRLRVHTREEAKQHNVHEQEEDCFLRPVCQQEVIFQKGPCTTQEVHGRPDH